jgi:hypothetical protein
MTTPIRPSLAQMLNPQPPAAAKPAPAATGLASALQAQKAFFKQVTAPKITPATYTAADVAKATGSAPSAPAQPTATQDTSQPLRRPGSYLNIVV